MKRTIYTCDHTFVEMPGMTGCRGVKVQIIHDNALPVTFGPVDITEEAFVKMRDKIRDAVSLPPKPYQQSFRDMMHTQMQQQTIRPKVDPDALDEITKRIRGQLVGKEQKVFQAGEK